MTPKTLLTIMRQFHAHHPSRPQIIDGTPIFIKDLIPTIPYTLLSNINFLALYSRSVKSHLVYISYKPKLIQLVTKLAIAVPAKPY